MGLDRVEARIRKINPYAKIIRTARCAAPLDEVVGLNAFSLDRVLEVEPDFLTSDHDHEHDDDVTSVSFVSETPLDLDRFQKWFGNLLQQRGQDILRSKGILGLFRAWRPVRLPGGAHADGRIADGSVARGQAPRVSRGVHRPRSREHGAEGRV